MNRQVRVNVRVSDYFGSRKISCVGEVDSRDGSSVKVRGSLPNGEKFCSYFESEEVEELSECVMLLRMC